MRPRLSTYGAGCLLTSALLALVAVPAAATAPPLAFDPEFPVSAAMRARVAFWVTVFTEVSQHEVVLHDRDDVRVVYDVVPRGPGGHGAAVEAARASYGRVLAALALAPLRPPLIGRPPPEHARVRALFPHGAGPRAFARAIGNVRAQRGLREVFAGGLVRAELYLPTIRRIFREQGLPEALVYLPHVESSFNANAVSRAGAAGLWQLTSATARRHIRVGGGRDDRFDPRASTEAAARYLARAHTVLGSWPLAVTAYNHGVAGMVRARQAVGTDSLDDVIRGYESPSFGFASRNFYAEVLAAAHVARHASAYFPDLERPEQFEYVVRPGDSLWKIARKHRVSVRALISQNSLADTTLHAGQRLVISLS